jgi:hypothetical protein
VFLCFVEHKVRHVRDAVMQVRDVTAEDASRVCVFVLTTFKYISHVCYNRNPESCNLTPQGAGHLSAAIPTYIMGSQHVDGDLFRIRILYRCMVFVGQYTAGI